MIGNVRPRTLDELETPFVAVDLDRVDNNIATLQSRCDAAGVANRPHIKTHKLPFLAHRQVRAGACGITVQKLSEAEVMVQSGLDDLLITYNLVGEHKARRLARLASLANVRVALDNAIALETVIKAARLAQANIGVLVEFESSKGRQGVHDPQEAVDLATAAMDAPHVDFLGLMTYPSDEATVDWLERGIEALDRAGLPMSVISGGGTPGMHRIGTVPGLTEYRAGTSVYHDRKTVQQGAASINDCALHVHATVVSTPSANRAVLDTGSKVLTSDLAKPEPGFGMLIEHPEAIIAELSEEHAVVDTSNSATRPRVGDRVRVLPNHVCPVSNLFETVILHRDSEILAELPVLARGAVR